jgi:hypothetical protein
MDEYLVGRALEIYQCLREFPPLIEFGLDGHDPVQKPTQI